MGSSCGGAGKAVEPLARAGRQQREVQALPSRSFSFYFPLPCLGLFRSNSCLLQGPAEVSVDKRGRKEPGQSWRLQQCPGKEEWDKIFEGIGGGNLPWPGF